MSLCPKCNIENDSSAEFCIKCGNNLNILKCSKCNTENPVHANFCMHCGEPLKETHKLEKTIVLKEMASFTAKKITGYSFGGLMTKSTIDITLNAKLIYLSGIAKEDGTSIESGVYRVDIYSCKYGLYIMIGLGIHLGLTYEQIKEITFAESDDIKQSGNVVGGAALGGLLLGPIGAIIGGMSQMKANNTKISLLVIKYELENQTIGALVFAIKQGYKSIMHKNIYSNNKISHLYRPS